MKAIRVQQLGGPEVLELQDVEVPTPGPNQVVVQIRAVGVNPVDAYVRAGTNARRDCPYTPGVDGAGVVHQVGEQGSDWKPGDRVYLGGSLSGSYAEFALCQTTQIFPLPDSLSFSQGAALFVPYSTAHRALFSRGHAKAGESVLIHGASGGVGLAATQLARAAGLTVLGSAGTEAGLAAAAREGAHHVLNHHDADLPEQVLELTSGRGVDLILEMLANQNLAKDMQMIAMHGRVCVIGNRGSLDFNPRLAMSKDADIRGLILFNTPEPELQSIQRAIYAGLEAGFLRPIVSRELPLAQAAEAHEAVLRPGTLGKIVLLP